MKRKLIRISLFVILLIIVVLWLYNNLLKSKIIINEQAKEAQAQDEEQQREDVSKEIELQKKILETQIKTIRFNQSVSDEVELILAKEQGTSIITHDKTPSNDWWSEWLVSSEIALSIEYNLIVGIPTLYIWADVQNTEPIIYYDYSKVAIISAEITNIVPVQTKNMFGEAYTPEEIASLTLIARDKVLEEASRDEALFIRAEEDLINELRSKSAELLGEYVKIEKVDFNKFIG